MRQIFISLMLGCLLMVAACVSSLAQAHCADYELLRENASYEMTSFDRKDRQTGSVVYKLDDLSRSGGKVEAKIHTQVFDEKGKMVTEGDFAIGCDDGTIWMDMRSMMNQQSMEGFNSMEMTMEGDRMVYPNNLKVGQKLADGTMTLKMTDKGSMQNAMTMVMNISNRTVEAKENVQVPAGNYSSYKIRQQTEMQNQAMGIKMPGMRMETVEYYVPKVGVVRSETYRNGKLQSYTVLSKIN
ncbi:TapB family protein [Pontibacter oryzae]|uniref:DUF3108 domain-containing protein n=1 Tax=Pontibacter oryzae TaxID=2304593 RepID=A0A399S4V8_9BACT|nr:hypothetical protein [Pontibacter oryzae]RIJ37784.1 hypothetical protein D1627_11875 [Pontibacter oryzae]